MKLFVQARKDGYKILYPKQTPSEFYQFAGDLRPNSNNNLLLGNFFYTIAFANQGCIFTKNIIVRDVQRQGLGFVGFSIYALNNNMPTGNLITSLLDELVKTYCDKHCPDYYLDNQFEDWSVFEEIVNRYQINLEKPSLSAQGVYSNGSGEPAYIYYSNKSNLIEYFDQPFQNEYSKFKQIFFIDISLKDKPENPLNAVEHNLNANLTNEIDLNDKGYSIKYNSQLNNGVKVEIQVNRSTYNGIKVTKKDNVIIICSKQYHEIKRKEVIWAEKNSDFYTINDEGNEKYIQIKENITLKPETHTFQIKTNQKNGVEFITRNKGRELNKTLIDGEITLTAEELSTGYSIMAKKGNSVSDWLILQAEYPNQTIYLNLDEKTTGNEENKDRSWYQKIPKAAWIITALVILSSIAFGLFKSDQPVADVYIENPELDKNVTLYVSGIELNLDTLNKFKDLYSKNTSSQRGQDENKKSWWQGLWSFDSKEENSLENSKNLNAIEIKIENAIEIRNAINSGRIEDLEGRSFSDEQKKFKKTIDAIEEGYKKQIGDTLHKHEVSKMNLNEISDLIQKTTMVLKKGKKPSNEDSGSSNQTETEGTNRGNSGDGTNNISELSKEFWILMRNDKLNKGDFDKLFTKKGWGNSEYKIFYNTYLSKRKSEGYKKIMDLDPIDRKTPGTLTDLKLKLK